jgi:hypothetical protein
MCGGMNCYEQLKSKDLLVKLSFGLNKSPGGKLPLMVAD